MNFEFDDIKSESNKLKHGIDFIEAQILWEDPDRIEIPARTENEERFMLIGRIEKKYWSAIFTIRNGVTRIISVRSVRKREVCEYES